MSNSESILILILLFQEKASSSHDDSADLSDIQAGQDLIDVQEDLIDVQGAPEDLLQGAMANPVTSTPVNSQTVLPFSDIGQDQDQDGARRVTRSRSTAARYLSTYSSCLLTFLFLI